MKFYIFILSSNFYYFIDLEEIRLIFKYNIFLDIDLNSVRVQYRWPLGHAPRIPQFTNLL